MTELALRFRRAAEVPLSSLGGPWARALLALAAILAVGAAFNPDGAFFRWGTHRDLLRQIAVPGILACGMTVVIVAGGIDLAVGSLLGLSAVVFSKLSLHLAWPAWAAVLACVAGGLAAGALSGSLIARFRIQPFIATLALMVLARGAAKWVSAGQKVTSAVPAADGTLSYGELPSFYASLDRTLWGDGPAVVTLVLLACAAAVWIVLSRLRAGRHLHAIGGNEEAARLSGVPVAATKRLAYGLSAALAAVAGICQAVQEQQGDPEAGMGYELTAIAIAVIGGNSLQGGRGGIGFTLLGAAVIGYLEKVLSLNAVGESSRLMLTGAIIIAAVLLQRRPP